VLDEADLQRMSHEERAALARTLAEMEGPRLVAPLLAGPVLTGGGRGQWRRRVLIGAALGCALGLAAWIGVLAATQRIGRVAANRFARTRPSSRSSARSGRARQMRLSRLTPAVSAGVGRWRG